MTLPASISWIGTWIMNNEPDLFATHQAVILRACPQT